MHLPLRLRLTLVFALCMAVLLSGVGSILYVRLAEELQRSTDSALRAHAALVTAGLDGSGANFGDQGRTAAVGSFAQLLRTDGTILESSEVVSHGPLVTPDDLSVIAGPTFAQRELSGSTVRLLLEPLAGAGAARFLVVGTSMQSQREILARFLVMLALGGPAALALASAVGWWVAGAALRPVERVRLEAAAISETDLDRRLPVPATGDELARLVVTLNTMIDRLQAAFERQRRFVDDASHELRSPLALLKIELDLALVRARTPGQLEDALISASEEADRLAALAEDLLVYSRSDGGRVLVHRTDVRIDELLRSARDAMAQRAATAQVRIELTCPDHLTCRIDERRARQVVDNLMANAIQHSPAGGSVGVSAEAVAGALRLAVSDSGSGFRPEFVDRAFEPFARDAAERARAGGGVGLGLAIVRAIALAHGGSATASNLSGGGAQITVVFPSSSNEPAAQPVSRPKSHVRLTVL